MKLILFALGLIISITVSSQEVASISFIKEDINQAKTKAKADDKIIFVDAYTTWCGPCKMMDRSTFTDKNAAEFYNENFVNLKMDMEKGEGPAFAQMHSVRGAATQKYIDQEKDWDTEKNIKVLFDYSKASIDSKLFSYMLENKSRFEEVMGTQKVADKINFAASSDVRTKKVDAKDKAALTTHFAKYYGAEAASEKATGYYLNNLMYAPGDINEQKYLSDVQLFMATQPELSSQSLNAHAWRIYELSEDRLLLSQAANWIDKSISMEKNSYNLDTKASILYKLGEKSKAMKAAEESIKLAQEEGSDPTATMEMLEKIKAL